MRKWVDEVNAIPENHPILVEARKFAELLSRSEEVIRFRLAEEQVEKSESVQNSIAAIKRKQKEWVHAKHYKKMEYAKLLEKELDQLNQYLDEMPIVCEFRQRQVEVNDLLQTIQQVLADTISKKIEVETGGPVRSGCGSGGPCNCS
ncbi:MULTISPECIES: RicAFT regulatory complex protein RicA family protein [Thermoactinomyces]|uniref:RicAFT regulatory complex protein RicA family protein n=1 Tax=Thermoactinomyces TaxID=2023 RepID=UPI001C68CD42|nr:MULTISPECIES: YlbF family regulator [Thermoactinomyces]